MCVYIYIHIYIYIQMCVCVCACVCDTKLLYFLTSHMKVIYNASFGLKIC